MDIVFSQYPRFFVAKARHTQLEINNITGKKMGIVKTENLTFEYIRLMKNWGTGLSRKWGKQVSILP